MESGAHAALLAALWADTAFLAGQGVMDYSLLVGVDRPGRVLVVGIIDFLRQARRFRLSFRICSLSPLGLYGFRVFRLLAGAKGMLMISPPCRALGVCSWRKLAALALA